MHAVVAALALVAAAEPARANRLARESSPYLLQHAHNPVDWFPWGPEAFERAKKDGKLVFLSIGYSSCHWCHVMERESFSDPAVAKLLNDHFVCVKVDREERPDVDHVYMTALRLMEGHGGWPLNMFLTPDGKPIIGGTYWPPDERKVEGGTLRGFKGILALVRDLYATKKADVEKQADHYAGLTRRYLRRAGVNVLAGPPGPELVAAAAAEVVDEFDPVHGGFGSRDREFRGPKFPTAPNLVLLDAEAGRGKAEPAKVLDVTLARMAAGGIYDHLGGGFHRYSTERTWTVPHFEKMLYDNAQLAEAYAKRFAATRDPAHARTVRDTLAFVLRELTSPEGAFYSALDADSDGAEGRFYVWSSDELAAALPDKAELALARKAYGTDGEPNFEGKAYVLTRRSTLTAGEEAKLAGVRGKLLAARAKRNRPFLDTKVLTGWNGQMIAGFAAAGAALGEPALTAAGARAADFVLANLRTPDGRLRRVWGAAPGGKPEARVTGYLDDYAYLGHGLLELHAATGDRKWLDAARAVTDAMVRWHQDEEAGGFFATARDHEVLSARSMAVADGAQPSANGVAALNLVRLARATGEARYRELAGRTLGAFAGALKDHPGNQPTLAVALGESLALADLPAKAGQSGGGGAKKSDAVVKVTARADKPAADGSQTVAVTFAVEKGYHIYANPVGNPDLADAQTKVTVAADEKSLKATVTYPPGKVVKDTVAGDYKTYEGKVTVQAVVQRAAGDATSLEVTAKFMACTEGKCLLPATVKLTVP